MKKVVPPELLEGHRAAIAARDVQLSEVLPALQKRLGEVRKPGHEERLVQAARRAPTTAGKVIWLRRAVAAATSLVSDLSPCRRGCNDCCHIAVTLTEAEARVIGKGIGVAPEPLPEAAVMRLDAANLEATLAESTATGAQYFGLPCTFLGADGACSIYEDRPLACRQQLSMDPFDSLLCKLIEGQMVDVPYLDMRAHKAIEISLLGQLSGARYADIRDWFPRGARPD